MKGVELYGRVRHAVQIEGVSRREAARREAGGDADSDQDDKYNVRGAHQLPEMRRTVTFAGA